MVVEFNTVRASLKETFEKEQRGDMIKEPFENEDDYITSIALDMKSIVGFTGGKVWFNEDEMECVYAEQKEELTPNLLISYKDFKDLYEKAKGVDVVTWKKLLITKQ